MQVVCLEKGKKDRIKANIEVDVDRKRCVSLSPDGFEAARIVRDVDGNWGSTIWQIR
jgi:hypothetical protein